jgi:hypothetical protein
MALTVAREKYDFHLAHLAPVIAIGVLAEGGVEIDAHDQIEPAHLVKAASADYSEYGPRHPSPLSRSSFRIAYFLTPSAVYKGSAFAGICGKRFFAALRMTDMGRRLFPSF